MTATRKQKGIIPDLPRDIQAVDKDGNFTDDYQLFFDQLIGTLQTIISPEGFLLPKQNDANINQLTSVNSIATLLYDSTHNDINANVAVPDTAGTVPSWRIVTLLTSHAGDPNGNVAGNQLNFCYDTVSNALYICTVAGDATTAVWTAI